MKRLIPWAKAVSPEFLDEVQAIRDHFGWYREADGDLLTCFAFETAETFRPDIRNYAGSGAAGLIQWTSIAAVEVGMTVDQIAGLTQMEQLKLVRRYFERRHPEQIKNLDDMYMAILWPVAVGQPDGYVLQMSERQYRMNAGLDLDKDRRITKKEAASLVRKKREKGLRPEYALEADIHEPAEAIGAALARVGEAIHRLNEAWDDLARVAAIPQPGEST